MMGKDAVDELAGKTLREFPWGWKIRRKGDRYLQLKFTG